MRCYGCRFAKINFNHIHHIQGAVGVGADPYWNQYGVTFTRRYAEPATGDPLVINPPSADCEANFNHVHDFHTWKALDTHGGKRCNFIGNYGTNIHIGVGIDKGHTSGTTFVSPAENILVALNRPDRGNIETGGTHRPKAVSVFGPADAVSKEIMIVENEFSGFGGSAHGAVSLSGAHGVTIKGNKFIASDYAAINTLGGFTQEVIIEGNEFIGMVPNSLAAIAIQGDTAKAKIGKNYHFSGGEPTYLGVSIVSQISGYWVDLDHQESQDTATSLYGGGFSSRIRNGNLWTVPFQGNGSPEGVVTAQRGMTYIRRDGTSGAAFYVKQNNAENTGWVAK